MILGKHVFLPDSPGLFQKWREDLGYTHAEAARVLGVTERTIHRYEAGDRKISRTVALLATYVEEINMKRKGTKKGDRGC